MKNKLLVLTLVFVFALSFTSILYAQTTLEIGIASREIGPAVEKHIESFEKNNSDIEVNWLKVPGEPGKQRSQYVTQFMSSSSKPDVIAMDIIWPGEFAARDWLEPLNSYFPKEEQNEFIESMTNAAKYNDNIYGIPLYINGLHLYYRSDLLDKYDFEPPKTWEELVEQAQHITENENNPQLNGFVSMWDSIEGLTMNYLQFLWGKNEEFMDDQGNIQLNSEKSIEALQFMKDMIYEYELAPKSITTYKPDDARVLFQQERAVFMVVQDFVWPMLTSEDSPVADKINFTRVPYFKGNSNTNTTCLGGWILGINKNSENKEEATKLIKHLTSNESQLQTALMTGSLPTRKDVYDNSRLLEEYPVADKQFANFEVGNVRPSAELGSNYTKVSEILQTEIHEALMDRKTPEEALNNAVSKMNDVIN
ncbi:MAG: ABC transporter substrate-binding protein [Bacillota bacterium]